MYTVLHIVKALGLGGTEKVMQLMVSHLDPLLFRPVVYSELVGERAALLRKKGITTYIGGDLFSTILKIRPNIIHVHRGGWPEPALMRPIFSAKGQLAQSGHKCIVVETNVFGRHDATLEGKEIATFFVSHFCAQRYEAVQGIKALPPRYFVLYNPIDYATISSFTLNPARRNYSIPVVGRVSRPDPGKWSELGLSFLPYLKKSKPEFSYLVIGGTEHAFDYVKRQGLSQNVSFLPGFVSDLDLAEFLNRISVFAHANDTGESFGLVIAEAMAAGLPVVTHPAEGLRDNAQLELVEHNKTGLVAKNAKEYAAAILWLLNNPKEAMRLGANGREKAKNMYAAEVIAEKLKAYYLLLMGEQF